MSALNLGHVSIRLHAICENLAGKHLTSLDQWQNALADAFLLATKGQHDEEFSKTSTVLYNELVAAVGESTQVEAIKGMFIRLNLTFERSAETIADQKT